MTDKKQGMDTDVGEEMTKEAAEIPGEEQLADDNQREEQDILDLQKEIADLNQRLLRVSADFDNFRRRTRQEKEEMAKYANSNLICELLPILDNFQRAIDIKDPNPEIKNFLVGIEMIYRQLNQTLNQAGLETIVCVGQVFDPQKHDAVMQVEAPETPDNTIMEDLRTGYMFKDKVIRPSMVKVAKNS